MLLPFIMPAFVIGLLWRLMFQTGSGGVDTVLGAIVPGMDKTLWLLGPNSFTALVITDVWAAWPFVYIMVLAALQSIQADLYDAAAVDGAGSLMRFRAITIPSIAPTLALAICLSTINHFNNFTLPFTLFGNPAPVEANVMPLEIFSASFTSFDFGRAAAIAIVNLLVLVIPSAYYLRRIDASTV
jgi:multiple sugar transport system permease protein